MDEDINMQNKKSIRLATAATVVGLLLAVSPVQAQKTVVTLWPNGAPGSENWTQTEAEYPMGTSGTKGVRNVTKPSITVYLPAAGGGFGTSVIVAPGGAFRMLSWDAEGTMVADWLQQHGVAAFVLKYRLTDSGTDGAGRGAPSGQSAIRTMAAADGLQTVKVVREHAAEWRIDPAKVGLMGFSAGGYVAVQAALEHSAATRPDFVASIYGCCITAADLKVPDDAPPIFFLHAYNDPVSASSPSLYLAWKAANKPAELHTYAAGGHGFGMPKHDLPSDGWIERFGDWLRYQKLMK
jgi:acetyl esterase/lipase